MPIKVEFNDKELAIDSIPLSAIQTGSSSVTIAVAGTAVPVTINFAIPFVSIPKIAVGITAAAGDAGYNSIRASAVSTTSVTFTGNSYLAQTLNFDWIATL